MMNIRGLTEAKAEKIFEAASKIEQQGFRTGIEIFKRRQKVKRISTGSPMWDTLL